MNFQPAVHFSSNFYRTVVTFKIIFFGCFHHTVLVEITKANIEVGFACFSVNRKFMLLTLCPFFDHIIVRIISTTTKFISVGINIPVASVKHWVAWFYNIAPLFFPLCCSFVAVAGNFPKSSGSCCTNSFGCQN